MATDDRRTAPPVDAGAWSRRLADQLRVLSEMGEALTYRLLEVEERLAFQEQRLAALLEPRDSLESPQAEEMERRLGETEDRLARIESLLKGLERPAAVGRLQPIPLAARPLRPNEMIDPPGRPPDGELDPFPDEGEQPFMDELPA